MALSTDAGKEMKLSLRKTKKVKNFEKLFVLATNLESSQLRKDQEKATITVLDNVKRFEVLVALRGD